jgi:hypothetical protein
MLTVSYISIFTVCVLPTGVDIDLILRAQSINRSTRNELQNFLSFQNKRENVFGFSDF